jgi:magnesium-transporting ATPase (P-type)
MTVQQRYASGRAYKVTGTGYAPEGEVEGATAVAGLLRAAALCCDARLLPPAGTSGWRVLGDTTEGAILVASTNCGWSPRWTSSGRSWRSPATAPTTPPRSSGPASGR